MLKGGEVLGKRIGYVVIGAGALTLVGAVGVIMEVPVILPVIGVILTTIWQFYVGLKLFRMP